MCLPPWLCPAFELWKPRATQSTCLIASYVPGLPNYSLRPPHLAGPGWNDLRFWLPLPHWFQWTEMSRTFRTTMLSSYVSFLKIWQWEDFQAINPTLKKKSVIGKKVGGRDGNILSPSGAWGTWVIMSVTSLEVSLHCSAHSELKRVHVSNWFYFQMAWPAT